MDEGTRRTIAWLVAVAVLAAVVRLLAAGPWGGSGLDVDIYRDAADNLRDGQAFRSSQGVPYRGSPTPEPFPELATPTKPYSSHPPAHVIPFVLPRLAGLRSFDAELATFAVLGGIGAASVGLLGRRVGGDAVGALAAIISALHPVWVGYSTRLVSEATLLVVLPLTLLALSQALDRGRTGWVIASGVGAGAVALTRAEGIVLVALGAAALGVSALRRRGSRHAGTVVLTFVLGAAALLGPWTARNVSQLGTWQVSLNGGVTVLGSNCEEAYWGQRTGAFASCGVEQALVVSAGLEDPDDAAALQSALTSAAVDYARSHPRRAAVVVAARVLRTVGTYPIGPSVDFDVEATSAPPGAARAGHVVNLLVLALAVVGGVLARHRLPRRDLVVLGVGPAMALITAVLVYGATRIRAPAEPALAVLAAIAVVDLWRRFVGHRSGARATGAAITPDGQVRAISRSS